MKAIRATLQRLWLVLHDRYVGVPFLLFILTLAAGLSATPKATASPPAPPTVLDHVWLHTGLPLKTPGQWGFLGHGGLHLPTAFLLCALFCALWASFALVIRRMESSNAIVDGHALVSGLRIALPRIIVVPVAAVLVLAVVGNWLMYWAPLFALYFALLIAYGVVRWVWGRAAQRGTPSNPGVEADRNA